MQRVEHDIRGGDQVQLVRIGHLWNEEETVGHVGVFGTKTGYAALDQRIVKTGRKKTTLLTVLDHPEIPLHNNPAELDERVAARRRDVSLHCRHAAGADEMDTFTPALSSLIRQRSQASPTPPPRASPSPAASSLLGGLAAAGV